ncbi:MAG: uroporphyrinogen-III synthase [Pseudomonadota bacterium]
MTRVLVTRAEPEAWATAKLLRARGYQPLIAPLTKIEPLEAGLARLATMQQAGLVLATSARALDALEAYGLNAWAAGQRWAVVGERAADRVRTLGGALAGPPTQSVSALIDVLRGLAAVGPMLYLAAEDRRPELEQTFVDMKVCVVYAARATGGFDDGAQKMLVETPPQAGLLYSRRSATLLAEAFALLAGDVADQTIQTDQTIQWLCLSEDVAEAARTAGLAKAEALHVAQAPTQEALFVCLDRFFAVKP